MTNRWGNNGSSDRLYFLGFKITADGDCGHEIKRYLLLGRKAMFHLDSILKSRDITLLTKVRLVKARVFPVVMYRFESWTIKKAECQKLMLLNCGVGEKLLRVPWTNHKEIKPVNPKGNQSWIFTGEMGAKAEAPILWPPNEKNWLIGKDPDAGKEWRQEEKGATEDEMVGWYHWLDGHELEQTPGIGDGQESVACYSSWGCKESGMTEWLNWTELNK